MLHIHLFGQPQLSIDQQPLRFVALPKTWPLLAYIVLHSDRPIERQTLAFTLWPDDSESGARANLRRHLQELRRTLPAAAAGAPWLLVNPRTVQWNSGASCWLDTAEFERLANSAEGLAEAVALYKGDLLQNVYDDWLFYERERLRNLYIVTLGRLTLQSRSRRDYPAATTYARQLLEFDPLHEDALRQLVAIRYEAGDRSGALQAYEQFVKHLREELAIEPMPETVALHSAIVRNARVPGDLGKAEDLQPSSGPEGKFQRLVLPFVGREAELEQLRGWWSRAARGSGGLVLIGGEAGIGKTRLVTELSDRAESEGARILLGRTDFAEPVPYQALVEALRSALPLLSTLDLEPLWLAPLVSLIPELGTRRGKASSPLPVPASLDPERERTRLFESIASCLEGLSEPRPLLVILEDLHWAGAATAGLLEFLARRASQQALLILATYRDEETPRSHPLRDLRRRLQRENQLRHMALGPLTVTALNSLVSQLPALGPPDGVVARKLYKESEGQPFFLSELVREVLETEPAGQPAGGPAFEPELPPAPGGVQTLIAARMARLSPEARLLAEVASVAGAAFSVELIGEVNGRGESEVLQHLDELLDRGLVSELTGGVDVNYAFTHHLIRVAIYSAIPPELASRRHRRVAHVMEEIYSHHLDELSGKLAFHFDRGKEPEKAGAYYLSAARRAVGVYADEEASRLLSRALEISADPLRCFDLLALQEGISSRRGARSAQQADLLQMESLATVLDDEDRICQVLHRKIALQRAMGDGSSEGELIESLKQRAGRAGLTGWQAAASQADAAYQTSLSRYEEARVAVGQALSEYEALKDAPGQAACYALLAEVDALQGHFPEAQSHLREAERLAAGSQANQSLLVRTLRATSIAAITQVHIDASYALGQQMLELCKTIGDRECEADAHVRIAAAAARVFHVEEAQGHYRQAEELYGVLGNHRGQAAVLVNGAMLEANLGHYVEAIEASRRANVLFEDLGDLRGQTVSMINIAEHALRQGEYDAAEQAGVRGLELARKITSPVLEAYALANLGAAERQLGHLAQAIAHMEAGLQIRRTLGQDPVELATDLCDVTVAYLHSHNLAAAQLSTEEMLSILAADPDHMTYPHFILWAASQTYRALHQEERAKELLTRAYEVLAEKSSSIPDAASRASFAQLPYNRELVAAYEHADWPLLD